MHNFKKLNVIKVMATKAKGRPRTKAAPDNLKDQNDAKDQSEEIEQNNKEDLAGKEKVESPTAKEIVLQSEIDKLKAGKVVEVKTDAPKKDVKIRPSQAKKQTHTVYVAKKRGDTWGDAQEREMSEQAYDAIAKDMYLKVTLPPNSRLVEPEIKGCKDC